MNGLSINRLLALNFLTSCQYMITWLCLNTALSYILSNSVMVFSLFTGLYLMSMGLGAFIANRWNWPVHLSGDIILWNGLLGLFLIHPGVTGIIWLNEWLFQMLRGSGVNYLPLTFVFGIIMTIVTGLLSGCELPLFSRFLEHNKIDAPHLVTRVLALDYLGTCMGVIVFSLFLFPVIGLINTIALTQPLSMVLFLILMFSGIKKRRGMLPLLCFGLLWALIFVWKRQDFLALLDSMSF